MEEASGLDLEIKFAKVDEWVTRLPFQRGKERRTTLRCLIDNVPFITERQFVLLSNYKYGTDVKAHQLSRYLLKKRKKLGFEEDYESQSGGISSTSSEEGSS